MYITSLHGQHSALSTILCGLCPLHPGRSPERSCSNVFFPAAESVPCVWAITGIMRGSTSSSLDDTFCCEPAPRRFAIAAPHGTTGLVLTQQHTSVDEHLALAASEAWDTFCSEQAATFRYTCEFGEGIAGYQQAQHLSGQNQAACVGNVQRCTSPAVLAPLQAGTVACPCVAVSRSPSPTSCSTSPNLH